MLLNIIYKLIILLNIKETQNEINISSSIYEYIYIILTIPLKKDDYNLMIKDINKNLKILKNKLMETKDKDFLYIITYIYKINPLKIDIFIKDIKNNKTIC